MLKTAVWMITVAALAMPIALQAQKAMPKGEEDKISEPAQPPSKKLHATKLSDQEKKAAAEAKKADKKAKRTGVSAEEEQKQKTQSPGS